MGAPEPGLVIPFVHLWRREHEAGEESGRKIRPCLIVVAVRRSTAGKVRVAVVLVTTQVPDTARSAVAIPKRVRTHLGLDAAASWVICDEYGVCGKSLSELNAPNPMRALQNSPTAARQEPEG